MTSGSVKVWWLETGPLPEPRHTGLWENLGHDETRKASAFLFEAGRRDYIYAHTLKRFALSICFGAPFHRWQFKAGSSGKPHVSAPQLPGSIDFNLTHTKGFVAVAVSVSGAVGIDAETRKRPLLQDDLVARFCTPSELEHLACLATDQAAHHEMVLRLWTRKEAFAKAMGLGLALPFTSLDALRPDATLAASCPLTHSVREGWVTDLEVPAPFLLAVAKRGPETAPRIHVHTPSFDELLSVL